MSAAPPQPTVPDWRDGLTLDELRSVDAFLHGAFSVAAPDEYAEALAGALEMVESDRALAAECRADALLAERRAADLLDARPSLRTEASR